MRGDVATPESAGRRHRFAHADWLAGAPASVVAGGAIAGLVSAQGGYFPTSWGWASTALLWVVGLWAVASGRTEAGRLDLVFVGLLALLAAWISLSVAWSVAPALTMLEVQRALVLVAGAAAVLVLARKTQLGWLVGTVLLVITGIATYSLATRLFPEQLGSYDPVAVYRLSEPVGYWNGLGIFCAMGFVLALGVVAFETRVLGRVLAGASSVVLAAALYFTYSRGAWLALAAGLLVCLLATPHRLRAIAATVAVGVPAGLGVLIASRSEALTQQASDLTRAADDGRRLALVLLVLASAGAFGGFLVHVVEARFHVPRALRVGVAAVLLVAALAAGAVLVDRYGSPAAMTERAWDAFDAPPPQNESDLNSRLFSFSSNGRVELWSAARDIYDEHRALGSGAGTFERLWQQRGDSTVRVRDAHGLYAETLAELGIVGLVILLGSLAIPLVGSVMARGTATAPAVTGAYVAFLVHAGVDWDWELAGVTLTALVLGCVLVVAARGGIVALVPTSGRLALGIGVAVASLAAIVGVLGSSALAHAQSAIDRRDVPDALVEADRARQLMPWSGRPWLVRGEAHLAAGDTAAAAASFRRSIEIDDRDWRAWLDLAIATEGVPRRQALDRARALYPKSTEIVRIAAQLAALERGRQTAEPE